MAESVIIEPDRVKSASLKEILLKKIAEKDRTPIKMIETISGNRKVKRVDYDFVPYSFDPAYQSFDEKDIAAFTGSADAASSYKMEIESSKKELEISSSVKCQATIFIDSVVDFEL